MKMRVNAIIKILLLYLFFANVAEALFVPVFAIFVTGSLAGATFRTVGFSIAIASIMKSVVQIPLARMLDRIKGERDDFWVMLGGAILVTFAAFTYLVIRTPLELYMVSGVLGVGSGFLMAAYYGIFARHTDNGKEGFEWSLFSVGGLTVSIAIGSAIGGLIADWYGIEALIVMVGSINAAATIVLAGLYPFLTHAPGRSSHVRHQRPSRKKMPTNK